MENIVAKFVQGDNRIFSFDECLGACDFSRGFLELGFHLDGALGRNDF